MEVKYNMIYTGCRYNSKFRYIKNDIVNYNGIIYKSLVDNNINNIPGEYIKWWEVYLEDGVNGKFQNIIPYSNSYTNVVGDKTKHDEIELKIVIVRGTKLQTIYNIHLLTTNDGVAYNLGTKLGNNTGISFICAYNNNDIQVIISADDSDLNDSYVTTMLKRTLKF